MKSPLWIINSFLIVCLLIITIFIVFSLGKIVRNIEIPCLVPVKPSPLIKEEKPNLKNLKFIEENDLFGTYKKEIEPPEVISIPDIPKPPSPKPITQAEEPQVQFLEPLSVKISGIIASPNESKSQVTLVNTKTNDSESYKIGDKLLDAYILRIFPRKIIVLRSNGQQDTVFMYQEDAEKEIKDLKETSWAEVVEKLSDTDFVVNRDNFVSRITSVASLIDMLDLTTAFKNGISIGCQIGNMDDKSIGVALGLASGDIILSIAGIAPTSTENRVNIYNKVSSTRAKDIIKVELTRDNTKLSYNYHIKTNKEVEKEVKKKAKIALNEKQNVLNATKSLKREKNLSLACKEFKIKDKHAMSKYGSKDAVFKHVKLG